MMLTGEYRDQHFPDHLVYTPATDYMDWRWDGPDVIDPAAYEKAARRFCAMIVGGRHKLLLVLPPENAPEGRYDIVTAVSAASMKSRTRKWNGLWRSFAARYPELISCTELGDFVEEADMAVHAYHYVPSALKQIAERIDIWFDRIRMSTPKAA